MITEKPDQQPVTRAKLVSQYSGSQNHFNATPGSSDAKDVYSIILEQAIIGGFVGESKFFQPAEIAILANAFELDSSSAQTDSSRFYEFPEITGPQTQQDGATSDVSEGMKLIYFSPDVYLRQPLNFSALPVIPPTQYHGRPIGIQFAILELDKMSGPLKSLLTELADLGQKTGVAQAAPGIGNVALDLGKALLDGNVNNDDVVFEYRMVLYPRQLSVSQSSGGIPSNETASFQPGRYVLLRQENRRNSINWDELSLDHNTARLYKGGVLAAEEVRDDTYLVVNIVKHAAGTPEAHYAHRTFGQFNQIIAAAEQTDGSASLQAVTDNIRLRVQDSRSQAWLEKLDLQWALLRTELENYDLQRLPLMDGIVQLSTGPQCGISDRFDLRQPLVRAELKVKDAAADFVEAYNRAKTQTAGASGSLTTIEELKPVDRDALIRRIALYIVPRDETLGNNFTNAGTFETAYTTGKNGSQFSAAMLAAINKVPRKMSCEELKARDWAK
jgi:hypothetical protein